MDFKNVFQEMENWLTHPFKKDMPVFQVLLVFGLFVIIAYIVLDGIRLLKEGLS